jgi:hypothetical protein
MPGRRSIAASAILAAVLSAAGCGGDSADRGTPSAWALNSYVQRVEPIRLAVNRLLDQADPILEAYRGHQISPKEAGRRFDRLERRFAGYTDRIAAIEPKNALLARLHRPYAHTYVLEDAYLSALAAALPEQQFDHLPEHAGPAAGGDHRVANTAHAARGAHGSAPALRSPARRARRNRAVAGWELGRRALGPRKKLHRGGVGPYRIVL